MLFDCIVIGKGLIGSASAKYLINTQQNVAILGPDEPLDISEATVFASHYDQARIQRLIGTDEVWTRLNKQSTEQYDCLQKESGLNFHTAVGCLYVHPLKKDAYLQQASSLAGQFNIEKTLLESNEVLKQTYPDLNFPSAAQGMFESAPSGYINPRLLIKAQLKVFAKNGGLVINDTAINISFINDQYKIEALSGLVFYAKKILLAPGAFINFYNLTPKKLSLALKSETIVLAKVNKAEAQRLSALPSLLYEIELPETQNIYLIQPVQYPDGNYYIKMGCNLPEDIYFNTLKEVQQWFNNGNSDAQLEKLKSALTTIMPSAKFESFTTARCIIARTEHLHDYIGAIDDNGLFVATGCNGYSAMCSDALGKIAANVVAEGIFLEGFFPEDFKPIFVD